MESIIKLLMFLKDDIGWIKSILVASGVLGLALFYKQILKLIWDYVNSFLQSEIMKFNSSGLKKHPLFSKLEFLREKRIKFLKCQCPLRRKIFGDLMVIRIKAMEFILSDFVKQDLSQYSDADFQFKLSSMIYDIFLKWEEDAKKEGIPSIIVTRFIDVVQDIRDGIVSYIQTSSNSYSNFKNNYVKMYSLLDIISGFEELLMIRIELELDDMNGEISSCEYKGNKCQHCSHCQSKKVQASSSGTDGKKKEKEK